MSERKDPPQISDEIKRTWKRSRLDISSGGVAYRYHHGEVEVALIATRGGTRWQLPKGSREAGETSLQTAIREVAEEVGLTTESDGFLRTIDFWYWDTYRKDVPELVHKRVDFFLLRVVGGVISDASHEVDGVAWFTLEQALNVLTFKGERGVVRMAQERFKDMPTA
ncbi:MAG: NUDIX domain-containing protein [Caldilineaceae bacterium]|nr:NUDIX domain-containing protein [Caldilineaceae bacterium]MCB9161454.1 NUDIX domain-containing protein [Caldilineaceae bacterium]MCB9162651.1 NUDIX domain-containing protein [Caldilineaceae bacterium]